ncbi:hypothetical protein D9757_005028 [Collybiopsis confluens]|uniref:Uncharacterized protein n=1 Tax=Collybiopsis confluens TaxID=2823264 RepID=A0A8H5MCI6_9AGAR|nr:hypothetical protein D9757_005028 [Collybiopsis confluens]
MTLNGEEEHQFAINVLYRHLIVVIPQTFVYGIYAVLIPVSSFIMLRRGLTTRARKVLFGMIIFMFILSTAYWIMSIASLFQVYKARFLNTDPNSERANTEFLQLANALMLVNYLLTDGVVVWRSWVLCSADGIKALSVCLFMLGLAAASVATTIGIRIALVIIDTTTGPLFVRLNHGIDVTQVVTLVMSVLTNSLATSIISIKAWRSRVEIRDDLDAAFTRRVRAAKIFVLLVETGVIYTLSCATVLIATVIPVKLGTLGDLYTPVNVQLAGIYPVVVLLLITHDKSLDRTVRAFASGVEISDFRISTRQIESGIHFEPRRSVLSTSSSTFEDDSDSDDLEGRVPPTVIGKPEHEKTTGRDTGPLPVTPPSRNITWGNVQETRSV